jgi:hypothetical protein
VHFDAVRLVMRSGGQCEQYAKTCKDAGLFVLGVLANESGGYMIANADLYQIGNEPDGAPPSSWVMSPQEYVDLWNLYHGTYPNLPMIAAGLSSGDPSWWDKVAPQLDGCKGVAVHPYGKTLGEAKTLLAAYRAVRPSMGLYVSEWNRPAAEIPGYDWWLRQNTMAHGGSAGRMRWCQASAWSSPSSPASAASQRYRLRNPRRRTRRASYRNRHQITGRADRQAHRSRW